jgi:hypothetical protein
LGEAEGRDSFGRFYNFPDANWLTAQYASIAGWRIAEARRYSAGGFDNVERDWIDIVVQKA